MESNTKTLMLQSAAAAILAAGALALTTTAASAEICCNHGGKCWHVHEHKDYDPSFGIVVHPDNWPWGTDDHFR